MSGLWYATAIAAVTGAFVSIASEIGPLVSFSPSAGSLTSSSSERSTSVSSAEVTSTPAKGASDAHPNYEQAIALANQAVVAYQSAKQAPDSASRLSFTQQERLLWQAALQKLAEVPASSDSYPQAIEKQSHYRALLTTANSKLSPSDNAFLKGIIHSAGVAPDQVHITLCQLDDGQLDSVMASEPLPNAHSCRHHQGDQHLASAASLIKLPIAIALMDKIEQDDQTLSDKIYIDPNNFTENAEGIGIEVDQEYTLADVVTRMLNESNNIATNQLIDYIGRDRIAKTMTTRGYSSTLVDFKLAGDRILPSNPGTQRNQLTSHDLTAMMAAIYGLENPGDEELLTALISQRDREIGHAALQDLSSAVHWLGEKTGQNDLLIGTTLAMKVGDQRYALTVAIDHSADLHAVRSIIHDIAKHLLETGPLLSPEDDKTSLS